MVHNYKYTKTRGALMKKVLIGMSGGVDSSVAALLLKKQGYEVVGVTMKLLNSDLHEKNTVKDAKKVCEKIGIEYNIVDFRHIFKKEVIDYFANEYIEGRTPNPCNVCNKQLKFGALLEAAKNQFGCDYIATGHYAKVEYDSTINRYLLKKSKTDKKDQTYALYKLSQDQLKHVIMPLGEDEKDEIGKIAEENDLVNANRKDSQEICFIEDDDYVRFIRENYSYTVKPGNFVDLNGNILGRHKGIIHYTIGQRKGLEIAFQKRMYVVDINVENNEVVLGDNEDLFKDSLICSDVNFISIENLKEPMTAMVKIRYSAKPEKATLIPMEDGNVKVEFGVLQRAITPGQSAVFYDNDIVIGGGTILKV